MKRASLEEIVRKKFGFHRGFASEKYPENSLGAIRDAINLEPPFVEFDVTLVDGEVWTRHPPREPLDKLDEVLSLFEGKKTYPKIDVKLMGEPPPPVIDRVLALVKRTRIGFVLINVGLGLGRRTKKAIVSYGDYFMGAENYFATKVQFSPPLADQTRFAGRKIGNSPEIRLNIDLERYRPAGEEIDNDIESHVGDIGALVYSVSPEIHDEDGEMIAQFAKRHKIGQLVFWLRGWPDVPKPKVAEETIRAALALEERCDLKVYFDINPQFIVGFDMVEFTRKVAE